MGIELPAGFAPEPEQHANFVVEPENWPAVLLFLSLSSQWRVGGMGDFLGLDYAAVEAVMRIKQVRGKSAVFDDLQIMERSALLEFKRLRDLKAAQK